MDEQAQIQSRILPSLRQGSVTETCGTDEMSQEMGRLTDAFQLVLRCDLRRNKGGWLPHFIKSTAPTVYETQQAESPVRARWLDLPAQLLPYKLL